MVSEEKHLRYVESVKEICVLWIMAVKDIIHSLLRPGHIPKLLRWLPLPERIYQHLYFEAPFSLFIGQGKHLKLHHFGFKVENQLFWTGIDGDFEPESVRAWRLLVPHATTIFDVGANTGVYALLAKCLNPNATVHAVEPMPAIVDRLQQNIELNRYTIPVHTLGLSNYTGDAFVFTEDTDFQYSVAVNKDVSHGKAQNKIGIQVERMDALAERVGLAQVDLIKLDVESHEPEVLEGMGALLQRWHPTLLIEVWGQEVLDKILAQTEGIDYQAFHVQDDTRQVIPLNISAPTFGGNYLLLGPQHHHLLPQLLDRSNR